MTLTQVSTGGIKDGQVHTADLADAQITAGKLHADALDHTYTLGAVGSDHYTFTGEGLTGAVNDPTLYLTRGKTYRFVNGNSSGAHPFRIQSVAGAGGTEYNTGVTNNAGGGGSTIIFEVPHNAPDVLYYICTSHPAMNGIFYVTGALADGSVTTAKIGDQQVTLAKLEHGTGSNDGKFLRANNGADPSFETVSIPAGTTINNNADNRVITGSGTANTLNGESGLTYNGSVLQINGDGQFTGNDGTANQLKWDKSDDSLYFRDGVKAQFGTGGDMKIFHSSGVNQITTGNNVFKVFGGGSNNKTIFATATTNAAELYFDNSKKFETHSTGVQVTGDCLVSENIKVNDNKKLIAGSGNDAFIKHTGSDFLIENDTGSFNIKCTSGTGVGEGVIYFGSGTGTTRTVLQSDGHFRPYADAAYYLGTSSYRWLNIYTADLNLSNEGLSNDVDGTWGSWTIQEGESDLFLKNNRSGKKYKFNLTEVT